MDQIGEADGVVLDIVGVAVVVEEAAAQCYGGPRSNGIIVGADRVLESEAYSHSEESIT